MRHVFAHATRHAGRRSFLLGTAGALAAGLTAPLGWQGRRTADAGTPPLPAHSPVPLPAPQPIPGGFDIPPLIHEFIPGPETITLPFTRITLQGLHVEPSTITDFTGVTALAYHVGTVTGSDGRTYDLETDVRVFQGQYIGEDGSPRQGTFGEM
jgi:hypothetical protein